MKKLVMMLTLLMVAGSAYAAESEICQVLRAQGDPCTVSDIPKMPNKPFHPSTSGNTQLPGWSGNLPNLGQNGQGWMFELCINGINLRGEKCQGDSWGDWNRPRQFKATGRDAIEVIRNSKILTSGFDSQGWAQFVVTYHGKYTAAKGKTFSCRVSPDARQFLCISWVPGRNN
jgi:hypothetical protein